MLPLTKQDPTTHNLFELKLKIWYVRKINEDQIVCENHQTPLKGRLEINFAKKTLHAQQYGIWKKILWQNFATWWQKKDTYERPKEI